MRIFMKKRNLILSLFFGSIFFPSIKHLESAPFLNSYKKEIISNQELAIPIAWGEGHGKTLEEREEECISSAKRSLEFFKRELVTKEDNWESTKKTKNKIKKYNKILSECNGKNKSFKGENSNLLTKKEARKFAINIINQKIESEKYKASKIDLDASYGEWVDQLKKIKDRIEVLEFLKIAFLRYDYTEKNVGSTSGSIDKLKRFGVELILYYSSETQGEVRETAEKVSELVKKAEKLSLSENNEVKKLINEINSALFLLEFKKFQ